MIVLNLTVTAEFYWPELFEYELHITLKFTDKHGVGRKFELNKFLRNPSNTATLELPRTKLLIWLKT